MWKRTTLVIINSLLFFCLAFPYSEDEYFENMITLKVGRYLKQEFYEVTSDLNGGIYIDPIDFLDLLELTDYTEFSTEGENIKLVMKANLFPDNKERVIEKKIRQLKIIEVRGNISIEKEDLGELLPLKEIRWLEEKYTLEISPEFNLPLDYRVAVKRRMNGLKGNNEKMDPSKEIDMFMGADRKIIDLGMLKVRYDIDDIGDFSKENEKKDKGDVEIEYSSQLLYGDFNMRHNLYSTRELEDTSLKYPYLFKNKTVTVGDNFIEGNDILGYDSKIRGISVSDNGYNVKRSGRDITIKGEAPKNSTVEIYQNGKIIDFQRVEGKDYEFTLEMRSQNDKFKVRIYDRNGLFIEERNINIMEGNEFLTKGEWDYNFFYGENPQGENNAHDDLKFGLSHGFTNNLTYSLDYYDTKNDEKLYNYTKHRAEYRFSNLFLPLLTNFSYYDSLEDKSKGYITELTTEIFSQNIYYTYEHYSDTLAADEGKDSYHEAEIAGDYGKFDYFLRFSHKNYNDRIEKKYSTGISYDITRDFRINLDLGKTINKEKERESNYTSEIGFDYNRGEFTYTIDAEYDEGKYTKWEYSGQVRKRLSKDTNYSYKFEVNYNKRELFSIGIGFEYKFNDSFKMNYDYDSEQDDRHRLGASFERVINLKKPLAPNLSKDPANGYVEGIIFIDKNGNGKKDIHESPLEGVGVTIGKNEIKTNKNGEFYLSNIYPYKKNKLSCDYSGTMIDPTLKASELTEVEIIPASGKRVELGLVPVSMIMGYISLPDIDIKKQKKFFSYVEIVVEKDGSYYDCILPEYDGFFVVQDLKPGTYSLKINYLGSEEVTLEKNTLEVIIRSGETGDFYDGIDFKVSQIEN